MAFFSRMIAISPSTPSVAEVSRGYRLRDGSRKGVMTSIHPDPRAQRVLQLIREKEILQAVDRLRLIFAPSPKRVIILCSIPLDITVDELRTLDELAETPGRLGWRARLERAHERGGILPLGARDLHRAYPDLFPSEARAKDALRNAKKAAGENGGTNEIRDLFRFYPHLRDAKYRRHGQRGRPSRALYDAHRVAEPQIELSRMLREIVVDWEDVPDAGSARRPPEAQEEAKSGAGIHMPDDPAPATTAAPRPATTPTRRRPPTTQDILTQTVFGAMDTGERRDE